MQTPPRKRRPLWVRAAAGAAAALLTLALLEGLVSLGLVADRIAFRTTWRDRDPEAGPRVVSFDAELGWVTTPGFSADDALGADQSLHTTAQRVRGTRLFEPAVPPGKVRLIASGDSFTFGSGLDDEETWCEELMRLEPRLEAVNFGVGGYGIDQAWLRYRRDGAALEHDLHLFCFISEDALRAVSPMSWAGEKPWLTVEEGRPVVHGVPVGERPRWRRAAGQIGGFLGELRLVQVARRLAGGRPERPPLAEDDEARAIAVAIFDELARESAERRVTLAVVHLPVEPEYRGGSVDVLRFFFRAELERRGVAFLDLVDEFRALPEAEHAALFLRAPAVGAGHYNARGAAFVAATLRRKLREIPAVRALLDGEE